MRSIIVLSLIVLSASCNMQRWCAQKFPPVEHRDTVTITHTVYRDTIVEIKTPADTVLLTDTIYITEGESGWEAPKSYLFTRFAESYAWVQQGRLRHELYQKEQLIADTIRNAIREHSTTEIITVDKIHKVTVTPWWHKWVLVLLLVVIVVLALRR